MSGKRVTSQDVARRAGVSRTTVSLVLNNASSIQISEDTRKKVLEAARELGYVPDAAAQALASRRAQNIGLLLTRSPHHIASDAFLTQILDGLLEIVRVNRMRLILDIVDARHQKDAYLDLVRAKRIDGILLSGPCFDDEALRALEEINFPTVLIGQSPDSSFSSVDVDNCAAAKSAVAHLISLGHRRIACITNAQPRYTGAADRLCGYRRALEASELPYDESLIRYGDFDPESGYHRMKELLRLDPLPSAVFVASDVVAFGAEAAIREHGLHIPTDMAVVGFDDLPLARYIDPPLTSVHLPANELARQAGNLLIGILKGTHSMGERLILDTHLVVRVSCGSTAPGIYQAGKNGTATH